MIKKYVEITYVLSFLFMPVIAFAHEGDVVEGPEIFLISTLISHVVFGLLGIMGAYLVWMGLLRKIPNITFLIWSSFVAAFSFIVSWLSGGYYYVVYYGDAVKPEIKEGAYPWAHLVVMETKEHVFLLLPVLTLLSFLVFVLLKKEAVERNEIKRALTYVMGFAFLLGVAITLGGVLISGAAR